MQGVISISLAMVKAVGDWNVFLKSKRKNNSVMDPEDQTPPLHSLEEHRVPACFSRQGAELDRPVLPSTPTMRHIHQPLNPRDGAEPARWEPQRFSCSAHLAQTSRHT